MNINMNPSAVRCCHCVGYAIRKGSDREYKHFSSQMEVIGDIMLKKRRVYTQEAFNTGEINWKFLTDTDGIIDCAVIS